MVNQRTFNTQEIYYTLLNDNNSLYIQAGSKEQVHVEKNFNKSQMKNKWEYFNRFANIQEIFYDLVFKAEDDKLFCNKTNNQYVLFIEILDKYIVTTIKIILGHIDDFINFPFAKASIEQIHEDIANNESLSKKRLSILRSKTSAPNIMQERPDPHIVENDEPLSIEELNENVHSVIKHRPSISIMAKTFEKRVINLELERHKSLGKPKSILQEMQEEQPTIAFLNEDETIILRKWILGDIATKKIKFQLLFNSTKGEDIEKKCIENFYMEAPIVILIKTFNRTKFGGYSSVGWDLPPEDVEYCKRLLLMINKCI